MRLTFQRFLFVLVCAHAAVLHAQAPVSQSAELKGLPACAPIRANVPNGWVETPVRERFSLSLPPTCRPQEPARRYMHGGNLWQCDSISVEVVWGMWGKGSFSDASKKCAATIAGMPVMVVREPRDQGAAIEVLYPIDEVHEPLVSAWSNRTEDVPLVEAIVFSARVRAKR